MGPARTGKDGVGNLQFDRSFNGVGRIKKSSGTTKLKEFQKRDALLTRLFETSALDVLRAFKSGAVTIEEIVAADRGLKGVMTTQHVKNAKPLVKAIVEALPKMGKAPSTRDRYERALDKLLVKVPRLALDTATVGSLESVEWEELAESWGSGAADWNHMRRALSAFLTVHYGDKYAPARRAIISKVPTKKEHQRTPDQSAALFLRLVKRMPEPAQACFLTVALTGMRIGEYVFADKLALRPETLSVRIDGKSGPGFVYLSPEAFAIARKAIPCPLGPAPTPGQLTHKIKRYGVMRRLYAKVQKDEGVKGLTLHDIRHLFGQTAADGNVPTAETQAAMRHSDPAMTRRYEMVAQARRAAQEVAVQFGIAPRKKPTRKQA